MRSAPPRPAPNRRILIVRDGLTFLALLVTSAALFTLTLLLFHSFQSHRADLATRWAARGRLALQQNKPNEAVFALRTALNYSPDERDNQFKLAEALAQDGRTEEATNYFLSLWEARPGDGLINLELARLARKKNNLQQATDYYRASIFGSWDGDGVVRRRAVRLELIDLFMQQRHFAEARDELFIMAGNSPADPRLNLEVSTTMQAAGYPGDALTFAEKALAEDRHSRAALEQAGRLAFRAGDYEHAERLLQRATSERPATNERPDHPAHDADLPSLLAQAKRFEDLTLRPNQPATQRASHILLASKIAQGRLAACQAQSQLQSQVQPSTPAQNQTQAQAAPAATVQLNGLQDAWKSAVHGRQSPQQILHDADAQDTWAQLIFRTETETAQLCGPPSGDDQVLLTLAEAAQNASGSANE